MNSYSRRFRRMLTSSLGTEIRSYGPHFTFWPRFLSPHEQNILLMAALHKLDLAENRQFRRRRENYKTSLGVSPTGQTPIEKIFLPDGYYDFQEGHYDGVIHHFREMHVASWPEREFIGLTPALKRLYSLCPSQDTQTHLLHLASRGEILAHVDNLSASGSWILGVSLGAERQLRMDGPPEGHDTFEITLPSGSVYLQRDSMRFNYQHSILRRKSDEDDVGLAGQRLSIMIRDLPFVEARPAA